SPPRWSPSPNRLACTRRYSTGTAPRARRPGRSRPFPARSARHPRTRRCNSSRICPTAPCCPCPCPRTFRGHEDDNRCPCRSPLKKVQAEVGAKGMMQTTSLNLNLNLSLGLPWLVRLRLGKDL